ncbi:hypothetical protein ABK040_016900 [Willaertia magna]
MEKDNLLSNHNNNTNTSKNTSNNNTTTDNHMITDNNSHEITNEITNEILHKNKLSICERISKGWKNMTKKEKIIFIIKTILWFFFLIFTWGGTATIIGMGARRIIPVDPNNKNDNRIHEYVGSTYTISQGYPGLVIHATGGVICLFIGVFQFQESLRKNILILHKIIGYIYSIFIVIGIIGAIYLIPFSAGGQTNKFAFSLLTVTWVCTLGMALFYVMFTKYNPFIKKLTKMERIKRHQEWMIRNYAASLAAITLRIYLGLLLVINFSSYQWDYLTSWTNAYTSCTWLSVVGNLVIAEIYINMVVRRKKKSLVVVVGGDNGEDDSMIINNEKKENPIAYLETV